MPCVERLMQQVPELEPQTAASRGGGVGVGMEASRWLAGGRHAWLQHPELASQMILPEEEALQTGEGTELPLHHPSSASTEPSCWSSIAPAAPPGSSAEWKGLKPLDLSTLQSSGNPVSFKLVISGTRCSLMRAEGSSQLPALLKSMDRGLLGTQT